MAQLFQVIGLFVYFEVFSFFGVKSSVSNKEDLYYVGLPNNHSSLLSFPLGIILSCTQKCGEMAYQATRTSVFKGVVRGKGTRAETWKDLVREAGKICFVSRYRVEFPIFLLFSLPFMNFYSRSHQWPKNHLKC